jgi:multidrug resistance efflux pump
MKQKNNNDRLFVSREEVNRVELHSEEVHDILGSIPHWTIRSGSGYLLVLILSVVTISWFIRYPDIIKAPVTLTTQVPPAHIVSQSSGYLTLWVKDKEWVKQGQYLGYLSNPVDVEATLSLMKKVDSFKVQFYQDASFLLHYKPADKLKLGELQDAYNSFISNIRNYQFINRQQGYRKKAMSVNREIGNYNELTKQQQEQNRIMQHELDLARQLFERDSLLFIQKVISRAEYEQKQRDYLSTLRSYKANMSSITNTQIYKTQLAGKVNDYLLDDEQQRANTLITIEAAMLELDSRIKSWEQRYMLKSPVDGKVALFAYWTNNQHIKQAEDILTVVPGGDTYFGNAQAMVKGSGKIKPGQKVNIKLDNFPFQEYGILPGTVRSISLLPRENNYNIIIELSNGLTSTYGKKMEFKQEMSGQAEIITEDMRLLERLFYNVKKLL